MGTSALISIEDYPNFYLYKHFDGFPDDTLPWLKHFNKDFTENRGDDPSYKAAQLVRSSAVYCDKFHLDASLYTGWGIYTRNEFDCDYTYRLMKDGTVKVR